MPHFSKAIQALPLSPVRKLMPYAELAKQQGVHIYHVNIGQPDIPTPDTFWHAIQQNYGSVLQYTASVGTSELRESISTYYERLGHKIERNQIIVTSGASEALQFVFFAIMNPYDEIIIPEPFYANYAAFVHLTQAKIVAVSTFLEQNFSLPTVEQLEGAMTKHTKAIMICNPNNPTGAVYTAQELKMIEQLVKKYDIFLIVDEVYREFLYDSASFCSALGLRSIEDKVIVIDSVSKRFSACGARIGAIITRNVGLLQLLTKLAQARLAPPTLGQVGATALYKSPPTFYNRMVTIFAERRSFLMNALKSIPGVTVPDVKGAFYIMAQLPVSNTEHFCQWMIEHFRWQNQTVMMAPGAGFYTNSTLGIHQVRIAYVLHQDALYNVVECLRLGLEQYVNTEEKNIVKLYCSKS